MKKRSAFTLIELLIVIAIIGILASLITMGVSSMRNSAREKHCTNNLRQLMDAVLGYAMDHGKDIPFAQSYEVHHPVNDTYELCTGWCTWVNAKRNMDDLEALWTGNGNKESHSAELYDDRGSGADARFAIEFGTLFPYVGDLASYACPVVQAAVLDEAEPDDEDGIADSGVFRTYAMNPVFGAASNRKDNWHHVKTSWIGVKQNRHGLVFPGTPYDKMTKAQKAIADSIPEASKLVVFADVDGFGSKKERESYGKKTFGPDWRGGVCLNPEKSTDKDDDQFLGCWHSRLAPTKKNKEKHPEAFFAQAIFFDGHVERLPKTVATVNASGEGQNKLLNTAWLVTRGWDWTAEREKAPDAL